MADETKLAALRAKYADAKGGDIFDPAFRQVAQSQFRDGDKRTMPFAGDRDPARMHPSRPTRRTCPISASSTWRWLACRWIWASPTARGSRLESPRGAPDRAHRSL